MANAADDKAADLSLSFSCVEPNCSEASIVMTTPPVEQIELDESEAFEKTADETTITQVTDANDASNSLRYSPSKVKDEVLNFSKVPADKETTFEKEFERYKNLDFDLSPLPNIDFGELDKLERKHATQNIADQNEKTTRLHKTQIEIKHEVSTDDRNISISCPFPAFELRPVNLSPILPPSPIEIHTDVVHTAAASAFNQMHLSNTLLNKEHVDASASVRASPTEPLDFSRQLKQLNPNCSTIYSTPTAPAKEPNSFAADASMIPQSVKQLYDLIKVEYSDFAFVYALSAQLCQERVPMDCFVNLKMGLLLSLTSISPDLNRPPIPILAMGNDTYMANYLLTQVGQLAARFVGPTDDIKAPSSAGYRNHTWIEADPILLAKGGVFFVGDWSRIKLIRAEQLFKVIECSRVATDHYNYPLEVAIWAHWRSYKSNAKDQQTFNKIIKIFGIPICLDDDNHEVLVNYILEQSSERVFESTIDHLSISAADMRHFLASISKRTVDLTATASELLQKYFVAARVERPECLTKQTFVALKQFAESFAKLAFRHEVLTIDALGAIFMCERFLQSVFGSNENSPPVFVSHNFVGAVDEHLKLFEQWLQKYIHKFYDKS